MRHTHQIDLAEHARPDPTPIAGVRRQRELKACEDDVVHGSHDHVRCRTVAERAHIATNE